MSGYFNAGVSFVSQDQDANTRGYGFDREAEIIFSGSTTLDNGLTAGARVELEAETSGDQIDETFMWISGSFGRIQAGAFDGAMETKAVYVPAVANGLYGVQFPTTTAVGGGGWHGEGAFSLSFDGDSPKVAWFSPTVGGAGVGVSFTPEAAGGSEDAANGSRNTAEAGEQSEVVSFGGGWSGEFGGANVAVAAGLTQGSAEDDAEDRREWVAGVSAGMDNIRVGAQYSTDNYVSGRSDGDVGERVTWIIGATYSEGPMTAGITYVNMTRDVDGSPVTWDDSAVGLGLRYSLGSGVSIQGELQFWDISQGDYENQATAALTGISLSF